MKVIICGAGQVGISIARTLSKENNQVTVIDHNPDMLSKVNDALDVLTVQGQGSSPSVLEEAGAKEAEMIIAVTGSDEVNMVTCQLSHMLFSIPTKIARIRNQEFMSPLWAPLFGADKMPIDMIISPEIEVARAILRRFEVPGAIEVIPLAGGLVKLIGVRCGPKCPIINAPLRQLEILFPDHQNTIVAIIRQGQVIVPSSEDILREGDDVYFVVDSNQVQVALNGFGIEEPEARRVIILGGGSIGLGLAQMILQHHPDAWITVIEHNRDRAEIVAKALPKCVVLQGDVLAPELLHEAGIAKTEVVISVTNSDETNLLSSLLAKRYGAQRTMALLNSANYNALTAPLGVDVVINPRSITVSNILQRIRRGKIHAIHSLQEGLGEVIEADAMESSLLVGKPLRDVHLPDGIQIGAVIRGNKIITPRGSTIIAVGDRVVLFATASDIKKAEKLFSVRLEYF